MSEDTIVITRDEANSRHVDDLLKRQMALRGESVFAAPPEKKWYYRNWLLFAIVGTIAAIGAWALLEPAFQDAFYLQGKIESMDLEETLSPNAADAAPVENEVYARGWITLRGQQVWLAPGLHKTSGNRIEGFLDPNELAVGREVGVFTKFYEGARSEFAIAGYVDPSPKTPATGKAVQPLREQSLADRVVDLVSARVREVLALEPDLRAPAARQLARMRERRGTPDPVAKFALELRSKSRVGQDAAHAFLEPIERGHERLGHVAPAERTESSARVGEIPTQGLREQRLAVDLQRLHPHLALSSSPRGGRTCRTPRRIHESLDQRGILDPAPRFNARAHVDAKRPRRRDRERHIVRVETAREHDLVTLAEFACLRPVRALAVSAARALEQHTRRELRRDRPASHDRQTHDVRGDLELRKVVEVELHAMRPHGRQHVGDERRLGMQEHGDALDTRRHQRLQLSSARDREVARRRRVEHESDRIDTRRDRRGDTFGIGHAADLDPEPRGRSHARTSLAARPAASNSATAASGSPRCIRLVPTSA